MNAAVLVISDQHFPYAHPDTVLFLNLIKQKYKPDNIVNIGDELDYHAISFHPSNPDLLSPGDELQTAKNRMKPLFELFPEMTLIDSNHGSLVYRKGKVNGLPRFVFKSYREILEAPMGWHWKNDLTIKLSNGQSCYFVHGKARQGLALSRSMGMNVVQGHYHERFAVEYWASPGGLYWSMQVGCLIDDPSLAFEYNKVNLYKPVLGCGIILNGQPKLLPMLLNEHGRWTGITP